MSEAPGTSLEEVARAGLLESLKERGCQCEGLLAMTNPELRAHRREEHPE